jgi:hypothetical protein
VNTRLQLLLGTVAVAMALPGFGTLSSSALEREIRTHMNGGSAVPVTKDVRCARKSTEGDTDRYGCTLRGNAAAPLRVRVDVNGRDWRAYWPPVQG